MDYGIPERRKTKRDKRAKARFNRFKHGGRFRTIELKKEGEQTN